MICVSEPPCCISYQAFLPRNHSQLYGLKTKPRGCEKKHDYLLIYLFVINDVSDKLASRELHEHMISFCGI